MNICPLNYRSAGASGRKKIKAQSMYKILKGNMPSYLTSLFSARTLEYDFRNNHCTLNIPKPQKII